MNHSHACKHSATAHASPPPRCAYALAWERARHHGNEFVWEGWLLQDEERI